MRETLKMLLIQKMNVKHTLEQLRKMQELTGRSFEKEINEMLDRLNILIKLEKELTKKD